MSNYSEKPSTRFVLHGYLKPQESYHPDTHNYGATPEERNRKGRNATFYTDEELQKAKDELKPATCPICLEDLDQGDVTNNNIVICGVGHKVHKECMRPVPEHREMGRTTKKCPICNTHQQFSSAGEILSNNNIMDIYSGGKKRRKTNKKRKTKNIKKTKKRKKTKKTQYKKKMI